MVRVGRCSDYEMVGVLIIIVIVCTVNNVIDTVFLFIYIVHMQLCSLLHLYSPLPCALSWLYTWLPASGMCASVKLHRSSLVPRPHPVCISLSVSPRAILKAICTGVGFGSGTETT